MAYPTGTLGIALDRVDTRVLALKQYCIRARDKMQAGSVPSGYVSGAYTSLQNERTAIIEARSVPGIGAFAQAQKGNENLDVVAEFNAIIANIEAATAWIATNFPKDGDGYLLAQTWGATGPVDRQFAPAATSGLRTILQSIIDGIS